MNLRVFAVLLLCVFCSLLGVGIVSPLLPLYAEAMGASGVLLGMIFSSFTITRAVVIPFIGPLSDRRGRKLFLLIGFGGFTMATLGYILAITPLHLIVTRAVQGATAGMMLPIARAYIGDLCPPGEEGKWQGMANAAFFGGFAVGPLIGGPVAEVHGYNTAFYIMGSICLLSFLLALRFLPESRSRESGRGQRSATEPFKLIYTNRMFRGLTAYRAGLALARGCLMTFLPLFAASALQIGVGLIGIMLACHNLLRAAVQPYFGGLADRSNKRTLVVLGAALHIVFFILIPREYSYWQLLVLVAFGGIAAAVAMPALTALYTEQGRTTGMGTAMSMEMLAMAIGMGVGPILGGVVADSLNIASVFYFSAVVQLAGILSFIVLTRHDSFATKSEAGSSSQIHPHD
jgi:MFS transporter, DHA1 family, multidrug resistance protein